MFYVFLGWIRVENGLWWRWCFIESVVVKWVGRVEGVWFREGVRIDGMGFGGCVVGISF